MIYDSVVDTVGRTPLIRLNRIGRDLAAEMVVKMESRNPCASVKDRIAVAMLRAAREDGTLKDGAVIVEATSGNTGIGLAFACAAFGHKLIITMPETMSRERVSLLRMFGAEVVLTPGGLMRDAVSRAREIAATTANAVMIEQFKNPINVETHIHTTAEEILEDTGGRVDAFVAGVGTGGTITGVATVLKKACPGVQIIAVEPADSAVLSGGPPGPHYIQGIGAGFLPEILKVDLIDEVIAVTERAAIDYARRLAREEGILAGISSGAALTAAVRVARRQEMAKKRVVVILPDTGERYMSTSLAEDLV